MRETLHFAAQLRLDEGMSAKARAQRAHDIMHMLGLEGAADTLVGNAHIKVLTCSPHASGRKTY